MRTQSAFFLTLSRLEKQLVTHMPCIEHDKKPSGLFGDPSQSDNLAFEGFIAVGAFENTGELRASSNSFIGALYAPAHANCAFLTTAGESVFVPQLVLQLVNE